jgi:hypothetical protein
MTTAEARPRWLDYVLERNEAVADHWTRRVAADARAALLVGQGFDPRMCLGIEVLQARIPPENLELFLIDFHTHPPADDEVAHDLAKENLETAESLIPDAHRRVLDLGEHSDVPVARRAAGLVSSVEFFQDYTDVVVDVSALPRAIYIPLLTKLLYLLDAAEDPSALNVHVLAGDAAWLDELIAAEGVDETASFLYPYSGTFTVEATGHLPRVWIPVLGENTATALERISELISPDEICPLLPFPARDPRRGDRLFEEYREVLFDRLRADSGTFIYGAEDNPFQVYRQLRQAALDYREALQPLGGCKTAFSALSSKLASLGVFLAAYELQQIDYDVAIADIGSQTHRLSRAVSLDEARANTTVVQISLYGDSYA